MQLVINVPDYYMRFIDDSNPTLSEYWILSGKPLPEHGRLIDADKYIEENKVSRWVGKDIVDEYLGEISVDAFNESTPTIIPSTKEGAQ